jgi:hypothetical protein
MAHQGRVQFGTTGRANAKRATEIIPSNDFALYRLPRDQVRQCLGGLFTAVIGLAIPLTGLAAFGSINSVKPNRDCPNLDSVAIDDVGSAGQRSSRSGTDEI